MSKKKNNNYIEYESNGDKNKTLLIKEHHDEIKPYLKDIIKNHQKSYVWKTQLTIAIDSVSSKNTDEERIMYSKSDNIELAIRNKADEVIKKIGLDTSVKGGDFVFDCACLLFICCFLYCGWS